MKPEFWNKQLGDGWSAILADLLSSEYADKLMNKLNSEYGRTTVYPKKSNVFRAFRETPWEDLRVVILGQDPYHDGRATGIAFANDFDPSRLNLSPSLDKIADLHQKHFGIEHSHFAFDPSLEPWTKQGVLMLNTALTVEKGRAGSHTKYWKKFTEGVLKTIAEWRPDCIFMLWGGHAKAYKPLVKNCNVLEFVHPAYACYKHIDWKCPNFDEANSLLEASNGKESRILW
jgi:uracil-DNA glycosylase